MAEEANSVDAILGEEFLTWLWYQSDTAPSSFSDDEGTPFNVYMEQRIVVESGCGAEKETASVSGSTSPLREARFGLGTGKKVSRALIRIEKDSMVFQFTLRADDFGIAGLKTPKLDTEDSEADPDALFLEKIFLMETCVALLDCLYARFIRLRFSNAWQNEINGMSQWLSRTE